MDTVIDGIFAGKFASAVYSSTAEASLGRSLLACLMLQLRTRGFDRTHQHTSRPRSSTQHLPLTMAALSPSVPFYQANRRQPECSAIIADISCGSDNYSLYKKPKPQICCTLFFYRKTPSPANSAFPQPNPLPF